MPDDPSLRPPPGTPAPAPTGPLDFRPPTAPTQPSDKPYTTLYNPYPPKSQAGLQWEAEHKNNFAGSGQFDSEGYPLPTQDQVNAYGNSRYNNAPAGSNAYDPTMAAPKQASENPYQYGTSDYNTWKERNVDVPAKNQAAKKAWQEQHKDQQQAPPAAASTAAPAVPFASSGIDLTKEGKGESFADSILKNYSEKGVPTTSNEAATTLDSFRATQPQDMSPYYDYASKLTSAKIDNAMSSRGSYGSSNATGQIGAAEMALRAQQAKDTAQYGLDRYAAEGNLAGSADASDARNSALQFSWAKGLNDIANGAQTAGQDRNQQLFDDNFRVAAAKAGNWTDSTGKAITGVSQATDAANNVALGSANDAVSGANADANTAASHTASVLDSANAAGTNYFNYKTNEDANNRAKAN